ncbi:MAG: RNA polymerase sigma factor [Myxococcota bacterium]|nr:RNA polymerase sigma factor [Myxococcota bacterium]
MSDEEVESATRVNPALLEQIHDGDRAAFSALIREHQRSVFFLSLRLTSGDEAFARDIVQKTFLQAWTHRASFRGEASFKSWILRIASNLAKNELRKAWRRREVASPPDEGEKGLSFGQPGPKNAFEQLAHGEARTYLRQAVDKLPNQQRRVVLLRLYEDLSFKEVGELCGISPNNAKVNFHHAVKNIRKFLAAQGVAA